jgi:Icc-related predicted phosphoesterase
MRVHVVSDVHGEAAGLAGAGVGADALICLGDLVLFLDYEDNSRGLFADFFGVDAARRLIELRTEQRWDEARSFSAGLWTELGDDPRGTIEKAVSRQYAELFSVMPRPAFVTMGNVDIPHLLRAELPADVRLLDGETVELGGRTFGFVGGGLRTPMRTPNEISDEEYAAKVTAVGAVDVLCCHIPPAIPDVLYDVGARRLERGSEAVLDAIRDTSPDLVLFGHVHNPLHTRVRIGRTECVNVGHFRGRGTPYVLCW